MAMQRSQAEEDEQSAPRRQQTASLSPGRAFVILLAALLVVGTAGYLFIGNDEPRSDSVVRGTQGGQDSQGEREASRRQRSPTALTNQEAIAKFEELRNIGYRAAKSRDLSLVPLAFTSEGPTRRRAIDAIQDLLKNDVLDKSTFKTLAVRVLVNDPDRVTLREASEIRPCFVTEGGRDVTQAPAAVRRLVRWTLVRSDKEWRLKDAVLIKQRPLGSQRAEC